MQVVISMVSLLALTSLQLFQLTPISFCFMDGSKHQLLLLLSQFLWLCISISFPHQLFMFQAGEADPGQCPYMRLSPNISVLRGTSQKPAALRTDQSFSLLIYIPPLTLCLVFALLLTWNQSPHKYCSIPEESKAPYLERGNAGDSG